MVAIEYSMLAAIFYAVITNEAGEYGNKFPHSLMLFLVKIPCAMALHLEMYQEIDAGLVLMKYANNHPEKFVENGDFISYVLGFM